MAQYTSEKFNLSEYGDGTSQYSISLSSDSDVIVFSEETGEPLGGYPTIRASTFFGMTEKNDGYFVAIAEGCLLNNGTEEGTDRLNHREITLKSINASSGKIDFSWWPNDIDEEPLLTKTFTFTKIISNIDYDLIIDKTVINLDNVDDRKVNITILKKTSEGTQTLTEADDIINLYRDNSTDPITSWEDIEITETTKFIIKGEIENREITFDEEIIEIVNNGVSLQVQYINSSTEPGNNANWQTTIPDPINGQYTWVRQKLSTDTTWSAPIRLTGEDAGDVKYIYYLKSANGNAPTTPTEDPDSTAQGPGVWTNNPTGISSQHPEEYMSFKTKPSGPNAEWSPYSAPALWSKWGDKGQDGAGVIYKFYRQQNNTTPPTYSSTDTNWKDNPQGVTSTYKYEYVAVIKTYYNESGNLVENTTNVSVSLWNHYVKDGTSPYSLELSNDSATIGTNASGGGYSSELLKTVSTVTATLFQGTTPLTSTISWSCTGGTLNTTSGSTVWFTALSADTDTATATASVTVGGKPLTKTFTISKNKQGTKGDDAVTYMLAVSPNSWNKTTNPNQTVTFTITKYIGDSVGTIGSNEVRVVKTGTETALGDSTSIFNSTSFDLQVNNSGTWTTVDSETVTAVEDGANSTIPGPKGDTVTTETYTVYRYYRSSVEITNWTPALLESSDWKNQPQGVNIDNMFEYVDSGVQSTTTTNNTVTSTSLIWNNSPTLWARFGSDATVNTYNTFQALTNEGEKQGIFYARESDHAQVYIYPDGEYYNKPMNSDGTKPEDAELVEGNIDLYVNADMIKTGTFSVSDNNNTIFSASAAGGANSVQIGGFNVNNTALFSNSKPSFDDTTTEGVYLGTDGIGVGKGNYIKADGSAQLGGFTLEASGSASFEGIVTAEEGDIGGWEIYNDETGQGIRADGFEIISNDKSISNDQEYVYINRPFLWIYDQNNCPFIETDYMSYVNFVESQDVEISPDDGTTKIQITYAYLEITNNDNIGERNIIEKMEDGNENLRKISELLIIEKNNNTWHLSAYMATTKEVGDDFYPRLIISGYYTIQIPAGNSSIEPTYLKIGSQSTEQLTLSFPASSDSCFMLDGGELKFDLSKPFLSSILSAISFYDAQVINAEISYVFGEMEGSFSTINNIPLHNYLVVSTDGTIYPTQEIKLMEETNSAILTIRISYDTSNFMVSRSGKINSPTINYLINQLSNTSGGSTGSLINYYTKTQADNRFYNKTDFTIATEEDINKLFQET